MIKNLTLAVSFIALISLTGCGNKENNQNKTQEKKVAKSEAEVKAIIAKEKEKVQIQEKDLIKPGKPSDGEKLYRAKLQKDCKMSGYALARKKSKKEWEQIAKNGKLADTIKSFCPQLNYKNIWTPDIYEFLHQNALALNSDS